MPKTEDLTTEQLIAAGLRRRADMLSEQALAAHAAGDVEADQIFTNAALAKGLNADLIGGSPNLNDEEYRELQELQSRFDKFMDGGETPPGGLTKPEYARLNFLLGKAGSTEPKKDPRR